MGRWLIRSDDATGRVYSWARLGKLERRYIRIEEDEEMDEAARTAAKTEEDAEFLNKLGTEQGKTFQIVGGDGFPRIPPELNQDPVPRPPNPARDARLARLAAARPKIADGSATHPELLAYLKDRDNL